MTNLRRESVTLNLCPTDSSGMKKGKVSVLVILGCRKLQEMRVSAAPRAVLEHITVLEPESQIQELYQLCSSAYFYWHLRPQAVMRLCTSINTSMVGQSCAVNPLSKAHLLPFLRHPYLPVISVNGEGRQPQRFGDVSRCVIIIKSGCGGFLRSKYEFPHDLFDL